MLTRIKEGSFLRSILKHNKGINDAKGVNVNWLTTSKPNRSQNEMDIQILFWSHNYYPIYYLANQSITSISWNHITLKIINMVLDIKVLDFSINTKYSESISSYKGDVRSRYMFTKDSWRNNLKHDDGWLSRCWHVSKKVVSWGLYYNITKELMMRIVWMWID